MAASWDLLRGDTSGWEDRALYLAAIRESGEPALDVGCGTGRLLLDFLSQGIDIDGVDNSPEMLTICREKADRLGFQPRLYQQEMEELELPRRYRTIIVPSSSFQLLLHRPDAARAMGRFHDHLEPGGSLVMPFMTLGGRRGERVGRGETQAVRPEDGALVRKRWSWRYDPATELEDTEDLYQVIVDGRIVAEERHVRSPATRSYTVAQARALYQDAGFEVDQILEGFTDAPAADDSRLFTIYGRRR
jgi:SAM-dependent methyltransferase